MTAKEIIKDVCIYLGKEEILNSSFFETDGQDLTKNETKDINNILDCLNFVTEEIATEYLPILKTKELYLSDGTIPINQIDENLFEIVSVKSKLGKTLRYAITNSKLVCLASRVEVTYKVYPTLITLNGQAEDFGGKLSARVLAYGVASEYCFLEMLYDDATLWENRFKNALFSLQRKKGEIKLKKRGWF